MRIKLSTAAVALSAVVMWLNDANPFARVTTTVALAVLVGTEIVEHKREQQA